MIEYLHFSNTKIFSSFWFPFLVSIYDRMMEILTTKNMKYLLKKGFPPCFSFVTVIINI